jgi:hypothetical protein
LGSTINIAVPSVLRITIGAVPSVFGAQCMTRRCQLFETWYMVQRCQLFKTQYMVQRCQLFRYITWLQRFCFRTQYVVQRCGFRHTSISLHFFRKHQNSFPLFFGAVRYFLLIVNLQFKIIE